MLNKFNQYIINMMVKTKFGMSRAIQLFLIMISFWWAVVLYLPHPTFETYLVFKYMSNIGTENAWATMLLLIGVSLLYGLVKDNRVIMPALMASTVIWFFVGMVMLISAPVTIGSGTYVLIGLLSASTYFYEGVDRS